MDVYFFFFFFPLKHFLFTSNYIGVVRAQFDLV